MAESLVGKIVSNAGRQWNRNTVADGNWLNSNTVQKFNENDKTLAEAIESVSAAMEHFTPEITPSAWSCEPNQTIQTIEQNADGSLNVTYQPIESSSTSDDSLWSWYKQNAFDSVKAVYTITENDINHEAGELSENLTIPAGIYDIKIEVLYEPTQSSINNKLDIAISKSTSIDDALYQTFILFDDSLIKDTTSNPQKIDIQSQWITGIIKLTTSTALKFLIKGESAQGRYKLNNIYINSIIGVKGDKGDPGSPGTPGVSPTVSITPTTDGQHIVITDAQGDHSFDLTNGEDGESGADGKTPLLQIDTTNAHWQYRYSTSEQWKDIPNTPAASGSKGDDGIPPKVRINNATNYWEISTDNGSTWTSTDVSATGAPGRNGKDGISPTVSSEQITGGNKVTFTYNDGSSTRTETIDVMSGVSGEPGKDGTNGTDGVSPSISYSAIPGTPGGTTVIITDATHDAEHPLTFDIRNGIDGTGATYVFDTPNTISGEGIENSPYGVNTEKIATHDWVGQQGYLTSIPNTYALKTDVEAASANALSEAETWVENKHYLTAVPDSYATKMYVDTASAAAVSQTESWVDQQNFVTSAGLAANTRYEMTSTGWTSAIKIQVDSEPPTVDDGILHIILAS